MNKLPVAFLLPANFLSALVSQPFWAREYFLHKLERLDRSGGSVLALHLSFCRCPLPPLKQRLPLDSSDGYARSPRP